VDGDDSDRASAPDLDRLTAYTYLTVPDRRTYLAIMRVFAGTLLADLSAHDVAERLPGNLSADAVAVKLENLKTWGNLLPSSRPVKASSIREYQRVRSRYQLSTLGERIQRQAEEVLASADAAREVSREMLGLVARGLRELQAQARVPGGADPGESLERISTLFAQFGQFADSVRDFYAFLGQVIFRYDLDAAEFSGFKELLLDYAETITDDVAFFTPQIEQSLTGLWPYLPGLLRRIDEADQGLSALRRAEIEVQRSRGRSLEDWVSLRAWFFDEAGEGSQVSQLRDATLRALQALLVNAKRMIRSATGEVSRRGDLLKLARWFDETDDATAHDMFAAAFGLFGARHLGVAAEEDDLPATTSWWEAPVAPVPVALRERGSRAPRGRAAGAEDYGQQRERLREEAALAAERQRTAAAELRAAAPSLAAVRLTPAATGLLLDLVARALAAAAPGFASAAGADDDLGITVTLTRAPGGRTLIRGADGDFTLEELSVAVGAETSDEAGRQDGPRREAG
jgi:uncharacterized protein (TIGR02677 family)